MTTKEMIETLRYKGTNIKAKIEPEFFFEVADRLEKQIGKDINVTSKYDGWISVKDKLPEEGQYIVTTKFGIKISSFSNNLYKLDKYDFADYKGKQRKGFYNYDSEYGYFEQDVLAWMSLPEPYKDGGTDD